MKRERDVTIGGLLYRWNTDLQRWEWWDDERWIPSVMFTSHYPRPDDNLASDHGVVSFSSTWAEPICDV